MRAIRFPVNPIITPALHESIGANINGPSLLRVPDWLPDPLGRYYLYFAHHQGAFIRLAYADALAGPWTVHPPGTLRLEQTPCYHHIASPDLHLDAENRRILMYYHGPKVRPEEMDSDPLRRKFPFLEGQRTFLAYSQDGLAFISGDEILGPSYFRVFRYPNTGEGWAYALSMPGILLRSRDGLSGFETGPALFDGSQRHTALLERNDILYVFFTRAGDRPEHILCATIDLRPDWMAWKASAPFSIVGPETDYEGARLPLEASQRGAVHEPVRQLRDPAICEEDGRVYLLYSVAGECGIAIAELLFD